MKSKFILAGIAVLVFSAVYFFYTNSSVASSKVNWKTFDNAISESQKENKKVIVSVYTDWCSWCKKMEKSTYGDAKVYEYLNENFASAKVNAESSNKLSYDGRSYTERELTQAFGITGYPATIFLDEERKPITVVPGYIEAKDFINILTFIEGDIFKTKSYEDYLKGL